MPGRNGLKNFSYQVIAQAIGCLAGERQHVNPETKRDFGEHVSFPFISFVQHS